MTRHIETDTASNVNISSATAIGTYTADGDRLIIVDVCIDAVTGNGDYVMYITKKIGGAGSAYVILPKTVMTAANGETAISYQSGLIAVRSGDILTVYVDGLAGDTTTPDYTTRWFESDALVTLGATQGAITWGQQKILANIAGQGALEIYNSNATGRGLYTRGQYGQFNYSSIDGGAGVFNQAVGTGASAQKNSASGVSSMGLNNAGVYKNVSGFDSEQALEATLTAMKGAGWTTETLAALHVLIDAIKAKTDNLPTSPAATGAAMTLADDAITASKFDESTAFPVKLADTGATQIARVGADSDTLGTLSDQLDAIDDYIDTEVAAIKAKTDLITTGTTLTIASAVVGSTITAHRGDTLSAALENIGALMNYSKLWFTVKRDYDDADTAAVIQIEKTGGLLYLNGAVGTAGNGSLTINDEATGDVTIVLNASETAKLSPGNYQYDIQILRSAGTPVSTLTYGEFVVPADVTRATS